MFLFEEECFLNNITQLRVAAYARVSTDSDEQINSLNSQKKYFEEFIKNNEDWTLVRVFYDEGISGTNTKKREGFNQMISFANEGKIDLILTKEVSRFARNTVDTLTYTRKLKELGVGVIFTIDNIDTRDPDGELRLTIMASLAQEESRKNSLRVKWGQKRQMEKGVVFGRDLIGYRVKNGELIVNDEEVETVKAIFFKYTIEGKGTTIIARELLEEGLKPKRVQRWSNTVILRALRNEKYVGDLKQKKTYTPDYLTHKKKYNRGEEDYVYIKNHHTPIIDRELWDRTQELLKKKSVRQKTIVRYWCSGKIYCGKCHYSYAVRHRSTDSGKSVSWRCTSAHNRGLGVNGTEDICHNKSVSYRSLCVCMKAALEMIHYNKKELKNEIISEISKLDVVEDANYDYDREINKILEKKSKAIDYLLSGILKDEDFKRQNELYDMKLSELETRKKETAAGKENAMIEVNNYIKAIDHILTYDISNELLYQEILESIIVNDKGDVTIYFVAFPYGINIKYKTSGKGDFYKTEIINITIDEKDI